MIWKNGFEVEWEVMEWGEEGYRVDEVGDYVDLRG